MDHSILAIVRYTQPGLPVPSGSLVQTSSAILSNQEATRHFVCVPATSPDMVVRLPAGLLLPVSKFLERQPVLDFYAVIHRKRMTSRQPCFIQAPRSITIGVTPYRFESEGECLYYLKTYELSSRAFLVAHVSALQPGQLTNI